MSRRRSRRLASVAGLTALGLAGSLLVAGSPASGVTPNDDRPEGKPAAVTERPDRVSAQLSARLTGRQVEIAGERTATSTTWANPDGTLTSEIASGPVRVRRDGGWVDVDTTLEVRDGAVRPKAAVSDVAFSAGGDARLARVTSTGQETDAGAPASVGLDWTSSLPAPELSGNTATYREVLPGADLVLTASASGFTEDLVLRERPTAALSLRLPVRLSGLDLTTNVRGGFRLTDTAGRVRGFAAQPRMWDGSLGRRDVRDSDRAADIATSLVDGRSGPELVLEPDLAWLRDPRTVYPVTIDPTITLAPSSDVYVQDDAIQSKEGETSLRSGKTTTPVARSLIKFDVSSMVGKDVLSTNLKLYQYYSASCTASQHALYQVTSTWTASTVLWSTKPTYDAAVLASQTDAKGFDATCPAGDSTFANAALAQMVEEWASGAATNYGLYVKATNETTANTRHHFHSVEQGGATAPRLSVTYNTLPLAPGFRGVTPCLAVCSIQPFVTNTTTPLLSARAIDGDGDTGQYDFEVWAGTSQTPSTLVTSGSVPNVPHGSPAYWRVTTGALAHGSSYGYRVRMKDAAGYYGPWSAGYITFTIDTTAPDGPTISSTTFPAATWSAYQPTGGSFSWSSLSTDKYGFYYGLDEPSPTTFTTAASATLTPTAGPHTLYVRTVDNAGNLSVIRSHAFGVTPGAITKPVEGQRTQRDLSLVADAPSTQVSIRYKWHLGTDPTAAFADVPTADVTNNGSPVTWPVTRTPTTQPFPALTWNLAQTMGVGTPDGPAQVKACTYTALSVETCFTPITVTLARAAFSDAQATSPLGPGELALVTGDLSVSSTDASAAGLSVGRSLTTLVPSTTTSGAAGIFGPSWVASLPGPEGGAGDLRLTDSTSTAGYVTLTDPDGVQTIYRAPTPVPAPPYTLTGVGDAAADGSKLTKDSSTQFTLTDIDGTKTIWTYANTVWDVSSVAGPEDNSTTTFTRDGSGRVTRILSPPPVGVSCATLVRGCQALALTYATTTTASAPTFGDYVGRLTKVDYTAWNPATSAMVTSEVAHYAYDDTGMLRQTWDPRLDNGGTHLAVEYEYNAAKRLTKVTPPALAAWNIVYDTSNRVSQVTRYDPVLAATAKWTPIYDVAAYGTGGPVDFTTSSSWGQSEDKPATGVAIFSPDRPLTLTGGNPPAITASDWPYADLTYIDTEGHEVNSASYGAGQWLVDTTRYDDHGNVVWTLAADNRAQALTPTTGTDASVAAVTDSGRRADMLAERTVYDPSGVDVTDTYGPTHRVLVAGVAVSAREHTRNTYDQSAPGGGPYHLVTTSTTAAWYDDGTGLADRDVRTTTYGYDPVVTGDGSGWTLRTPTTSTTVMPGTGTNITATTRHDTNGRTIETRQPLSSGTDAGTTTTVYYTTTANATYPTCGGHAEWYGQVCRVAPAAQPAGTTIPVTQATSYTYYGAVATATETSGTTVRTTTATYDAAGRPTTSSVSVSPTPPAGQELGNVTYAYASATGLPTTTTVGTAVITQGYDTLGRPTSSTDADANTTTTTYDLTGRPATVNDGKGTYTYTYDGTDAAGLTERRGLVTALDVGISGSPDVFTGAYDPAGRLASQTYPNGLIATSTFDNAGEHASLSYAKAATTWLAFAQQANIHGQTVTAGGPATSQDYSYDNAGRLTRVDDHTAAGCAIRTYGFSKNSNRTYLYGVTGPPDGSCPAPSSSTTPQRTYDTADRLTDTGYSYDTLGRTTAIPAADAGGTALTAAYYVNDMARALTHGAASKTWTLDPARRFRAMTDSVTAKTTTNHYPDGGGDSPSWLGVSDGTWTRNVKGLTGALALIQANTGTPQIQLTNPHGDIVATVDDTPTPTGINAYFESDEYGNNRASNPSNPRYAWLGAAQRSADALAGVVLMGVRLYNPATGRFLQTDPVRGGNPNVYTYPVDPINMVDLDGRAAFSQRWVWKRPIGCACGKYRSRYIGLRAVNPGRYAWFYAGQRPGGAGWVLYDTHNDLSRFSRMTYVRNSFKSVRIYQLCQDNTLWEVSLPGYNSDVHQFMYQNWDAQGLFILLGLAQSTTNWRTGYVWV